MLHHTLAALLAMVLLLTGCNKHAADEEQIKQLYAQLDNANNNGDGAAVVKIMTDETFTFYTPLLNTALNAPADKVRALPGAEMHEVLLMRAKGSRAELEKLSGRQYVEFATSKGWYATRPADRTTDTLRRFKFQEGSATAQVYSDGEDAEISYRFEKVDGVWKIDERHAYASISRLIEKAAAELGMSTPEFVELAVQEHLGHPLPESVWSPMR